MLGKRKRYSLEQDASSLENRASADSETENSLREKFKRHFEMSFKPLERFDKTETQSSFDFSNDRNVESFEDDISQQESAWSGVSSDEDTGVVEVIDHQAQPLALSAFKSGAKKYMSPKPPMASKTEAQRSKPLKTSPAKQGGNEDDANLKDDLALHRLLSESHLLDQHGGSSSRAHRQRIVDKRLQKLGSKSSILEQTQMPMSHRKGIIAKAKEREGRRRQEAKESGIVLERPSLSQKGGQRERVQGLKTSIGKFKDGTLTLSKKDVAKVNGRRAGGTRSNK